MRLEIDYSVLNENFSFSGYLHSFYSPHFSVNYSKNIDFLSIYLTSYPKKINLKTLKLYLKLPNNLYPIFPFVNSEVICESQIIFRSDDLFYLFYSPDETNGITNFSFSNNYLIVNKKFCGKPIFKGDNNVLYIKQIKAHLIDIFKERFLHLSSQRSKRLSAWILSKFDRKVPRKDGYYDQINKLLYSPMSPDYLYLDNLIKFPNSNPKEISALKSNFEPSKISFALSVPLFFVKKNSYMHEKFSKKIVNSASGEKFYKDFVLLNPNDKELLKFFKDKIFEYLSSGISMLRFENLYPTMKFYDLRWKILDFSQELVKFIKREFPKTKVMIDIPPSYFSSDADFVQLQSYMRPQGTFFKSLKVNRDLAIKTIFSVLSNSVSANFVLPIPSFSKGILSDDEQYFVSVMNYMFSSMIFFDGDVSLYSREEISIFKKMLRIFPNIRDINYDRGLFKIDFFTDDNFTLYINLSQDIVDINSFKIKPLSLAIFDKEKVLRRWPFRGW